MSTSMSSTSCSTSTSSSAQSVNNNVPVTQGVAPTVAQQARQETVARIAQMSLGHISSTSTVSPGGARPLSERAVSGPQASIGQDEDGYQKLCNALAPMLDKDELAHVCKEIASSVKAFERQMSLTAASQLLAPQDDVLCSLNCETTLLPEHQKVFQELSRLLNTALRKDISEQEHKHITEVVMQINKFNGWGANHKYCLKCVSLIVKYTKKYSAQPNSPDCLKYVCLTVQVALVCHKEAMCIALQKLAKTNQHNGPSLQKLIVLFTTILKDKSLDQQGEFVTTIHNILWGILLPWTIHCSPKIPFLDRVEAMKKCVDILLSEDQQVALQVPVFYSCVDSCVGRKVDPECLGKNFQIGLYMRLMGWLQTLLGKEGFDDQNKLRIRNRLFPLIQKRKEEWRVNFFDFSVRSFCAVVRLFQKDCPCEDEYLQNYIVQESARLLPYLRFDIEPESIRLLPDLNLELNSSLFKELLYGLLQGPQWILMSQETSETLRNQAAKVHCDLVEKVLKTPKLQAYFDYSDYFDFVRGLYGIVFDKNVFSDELKERAADLLWATLSLKKQSIKGFQLNEECQSSAMAAQWFGMVFVGCSTICRAEDRFISSDKKTWAAEHILQLVNDCSQERLDQLFEEEDSRAILLVNVSYALLSILESNVDASLQRRATEVLTERLQLFSENHAFKRAISKNILLGLKEACNTAVTAEIACSYFYRLKYQGVLRGDDVPLTPLENEEIQRLEQEINEKSGKCDPREISVLRAKISLIRLLPPGEGMRVIAEQDTSYFMGLACLAQIEHSDLPLTIKTGLRLYVIWTQILEKDESLVLGLINIYKSIFVNHEDWLRLPFSR